MSSIPSSCLQVDLKNLLIDQKVIRGPHSPFPPNTAATTASNTPFHIYHPAFLDIVGSTPKLELLIEDPKYAFCWEAPVYIPETDELFFAAMAGQAHRSFSGLDNNNKLFKVKLSDVKPGSKREDFVVDVTPDSPYVQMINGGTNYGSNQMLFCCEGRGEPYPGGIACIDSTPPYKVTPVVYNVYGRRFCAPNDICVHPTSGAIFFTDPNYAEKQGFGAVQSMPNFVWRFDPKTQQIRAVGNGLGEPNGIVFSPDGKIAYVTDTEAAGGKNGYDGTSGAHIYAFDVVEETVEGKPDLSSQTLSNKRLFAWVDTGVPDGIKVDTKGNVYSCCGDGVHIWSSTGILLGKIVTGADNGCGNLAFCGDGRLVFQSGERMWMATLATNGVPLHTYPSVEL